MDTTIYPFIVVVATTLSTYAVVRITKQSWLSWNTLLIFLYAFSMSAIISLAIVIVLDLIWFFIYHTSLTSHLRDGDLAERITEAIWQ